MGLLSGWIDKMRKKERRACPRYETNGIDAVYWTGSLSCSHPVREISLTGAYIETRLSWHSGTLIRMSLRRSADLAELPGANLVIDLWARVIRSVDGGFCVEFVIADPVENAKLRQFMECNVVGYVYEPRKVKKTNFGRAGAC
jgi:hypothetical protein